MRVVELSGVESRPGGVTLLAGTACARLTVGDALQLCDAVGAREPVTVAGVLVAAAGAMRLLDAAGPGEAVQVIVRRRTPSVDLGRAVALERD